MDYETSLLPWLIGRGWVLYRDVADQHPPLLPVLLALVGGDPGLPLHAVVIGLGALTLALTYAVAARWTGPGAGLSALALTAVWWAALDGTHLWYDGALAPCYLAVLWLLLGTPGWRSALGIGLLLGIALLIKQHALLAVPFVALALIMDGKQGREQAAPTPNPRAKIGLFALGLALPLAAATLILAAQGALPAAAYWIIGYNLSGDYARLAALPPPPGDWPLLAALYAPALAFALVLFVRTPHSAVRTPHCVAWFGLLLAATVPAWPRYGPFHFAAAVPLLAVAGATILDFRFWILDFRNVLDKPKIQNPKSKIISLALVGVSALVGAGQAAQFVRVSVQVGGPETPYAATLGPLRAWVDGHAPAGAPIVVYGLDALLYRVLERESPRPWAAQLPWLLTGTTEAQVWVGMAQARPPLALVSATGWAASPQPGPATGEGRLRADYHEAARFTVAIYSQAPPVAVVGLLRNKP